MLTVHIITQNNEKTLSRCLDSIQSSFPDQFCKIVVGDCNSTDGTLEICKRHDVRVVDVGQLKNMSLVRNKLIQNDTKWQFYLEPWEVLASGQDHIYHTVISGKEHLRFNVVQGDVLTKEIRLWRGEPFTGQVFEQVNLSGGSVVGLIASDNPTNHLRNKAIIDQWCQDCPALPEPFYYRACIAIGEKRFKNFMEDTEYYKFLTRGKEPSQRTVMLWYYQACVECFRNHMADRSLQLCIACLSANPVMAEFWCLLGDIHYHLLHNFDKALIFYENAQIIGARRKGDDDWAMEISKYRDYPEKLIANCKQIVEASKQLAVTS